MAATSVRRRSTGDPEAQTFEPSTGTPDLVRKRRPTRTRLGARAPPKRTFEPKTPASSSPPEPSPTGTAGGPRPRDSEEKCRRRDFFADRAHNDLSLVGGMSGAPPASAGLAPTWAATVVSGGFSSNRIPGGCGLRCGRPGKELRAGVPMRQNRRPMGGRHLSGRGGLRDSRRCFGPLSSHPYQVSSP
jgi:hypothetical protein